MDAYTFVESMRQERSRILPIIIIPLMIAFIFTVLECLSARSYAKERNDRKYKRNLTLSEAARTKVELETKELTAR